MEHFSDFFIRYPAFFFGLLITLGTGIALYPPVAILLLLLLFLPKSELYKAAIVVCISFFHTSSQMVPSEDSYTNGVFSLSDIRPLTTPFSQSLIAYGTLYTEKNPPIKCSTALKKGVPNGSTFLYSSALRKGGRLIGTPQEMHSPPFSKVGLLRYSIKQRILSYVKKYYRSHLSQSFLQTIATGFSVSTIIEEHFSRCGLSHILAVSGFHFSLILSTIFFLSKRWFGKKWGALCCMFLGTALTFYYGETASVLRAYEMSLFLFLAFFLDRSPKPINLLGMALICSLTFSPLSLMRLGFQLSFSATMGLLILFPALLAFTERYIPKAPYLIVKNWPPQNKARYLASRLILSLFLLTISAILSTVPILLCSFHYFPIATLIYNLFMPPLIACSMFLFLIGVIIPPIHSLNGLFLSLIFTPIVYQPRWTMGAFFMNLPPIAAIFSLIALFGMAIFYVKNNSTLFPITRAR